MNPRATDVKYESRYELILSFTNGELKEFDFSSYLNYPVYKILKDKAFCKKAKVFNGTVIFDEVTDFDPDTLYLDSNKLVTF